VKNPHHSAHFFGDLEALFDSVEWEETFRHNLVGDVDAAVEPDSREFKHETAFCNLESILNACVLASWHRQLKEAYQKSILQQIPLSAFGGVFDPTNQTVGQARS